MVRHSRLIALNMKHRRPQHRWTQEERLILCVMKRFFDLNNKGITRIFNYTYGNKIRAEGFSGGLPSSTVSTQWWDLLRRNHCDWHTVHTDVSFELGPSRFPHLIGKIRNACQVLQIGLVARARDLAVQHPQETSKRRHSQIGGYREKLSASIPQIGASNCNDASTAPRSIIAIHDPIVEQDDQEAPSPLKNVPQESEAISADSKPRVPVPREIVSRIWSFALGSRNERPTRPSQVPKILWRFSNDMSMGINHRSGYVSHAFIGEIGHIPTPDERAEEFPTWLEIHVRPRRIPSPFISTSTDALVAVHRAVTRDGNAFVSIIDSTQIDSQNIFYMKDLMQQYKIYTPGYRGAKEYVVWGYIARPAIITSIRAEELNHIANLHPDIQAALQLEIISESPNCKSQLHNRLAAKTFESDFAVGKTIGKFLRIIHLQREFLQDVAKSLNASWSFTVTDDTTEFLEGVNQGYQITATPSSPAPIPEITFHSQDTVYSQNQTESASNGNRGIAQPIAQIVDMEDYVIIDPPQPQEHAIDGHYQELRQSMDRLSFQEDAEEDAEELSDHIEPTIQLPPSTASTTARRTISLFNPASESWVAVPETRRPSTPRVLQSIEGVLPPSGQGDNNGEDATKTFIKRESRTSSPTPIPQPDSRSQEFAVLQQPTTPFRNHTRSYSASSESTISAQTPVANQRFSQERAHVNRVLDFDWPTFWDSLHGVGQQ